MGGVNPNYSELRQFTNKYLKIIIKKSGRKPVRSTRLFDLTIVSLGLSDLMGGVRRIPEYPEVEKTAKKIRPPFLGVPDFFWPRAKGSDSLRAD
jgi:hypothetical protein